VESYIESCAGLLAWNSGEFTRSIERLEAALDIATEIGNRPAQAGALAHLAVVEHSRGDYRRALRYQERLLEIRREDGDRAGESLSLAARGEAKLALGEPVAARADIETSLAIATELAVPLYEAEAWLALAELEWNLANRDASRAAAERAFSIVEGSGEMSTTEGAALMIARLDVEEGDVDAARKRLETVRTAAGEIGRSGVGLLAAALLASLPGGDPEALQPELVGLELRAPHHYRLEARLVLWRTTGDLRHLTEARRMAREARERAGPSHREAILVNVRLHREIEEAWKRR
jgi:tetratricopeptide (TPR) repeat protein